MVVRSNFTWSKLLIETIFMFFSIDQNSLKCFFKTSDHLAKLILMPWLIVQKFVHTIGKTAFGLVTRLLLTPWSLDWKFCHTIVKTAFDHLAELLLTSWSLDWKLCHPSGKTAFDHLTRLLTDTMVTRSKVCSHYCKNSFRSSDHTFNQVKKTTFIQVKSIFRSFPNYSFSFEINFKWIKKG
jgi:hypothetical protein